MKHKYKLQNLVSKLLLLTILVSSMSLSAVSNVRADYILEELPAPYETKAVSKIEHPNTWNTSANLNYDYTYDIHSFNETSVIVLDSIGWNRYHYYVYPIAGDEYNTTTAYVQGSSAYIYIYGADDAETKTVDSEHLLYTQNVPSSGMQNIQITLQEIKGDYDYFFMRMRNTGATVNGMDRAYTYATSVQLKYRLYGYPTPKFNVQPEQHDINAKQPTSMYWTAVAAYTDTYTWQISDNYSNDNDDTNDTWVDISNTNVFDGINSSADTTVLTLKSLSGLPYDGQYIRCLAHNAQGDTASDAVKISYDITSLSPIITSNLTTLN